MRLLRLLLALGGLLGGGYVLVSTLLAVAAIHHDLPFMDSWDQVFGYELYCRGELPFDALWLQHNEHRIPLQRLIYLLDFAWCRGRGLLPIACGFALQFAQVGLLLWLVRRTAALALSERVFVAGIAVAATFSAVQLENFYWPFQTQFFLVYATGLGAIAVLAAALRDGALRIGWFLVSLVLAVGATGSMANGVLVWPLLLLLALHRRAPKSVSVAIALAATVTVGAFAIGYRLPEHGPAPDQPILRFVTALVYLGGNTLPPPSRAATAVLGALAWLGAAALLVTFRWLRARDAAVSAGMFGVLFLAGGLAVIAIGRGGSDGALVVTSRYATPLLLLWAYGLTFAWVRARQAGSRIGAGLAVVALLGWAGLLVGGQPHAVAHHRPHHDRQVRAAMALVNGVRDEAALRACHDVDPGYLVERARTLRAHGLATFRFGWQDRLGEPVTQSFVVVPGELPHAAIENVHAVSGEPEAFRLEGWSQDPARGVGFDWLLCTDRAGTILGIGEGGVGASPAARRDPAVGAEGGGWVGYFRLPPGTVGPVEIFVYAVHRDLRTVQAIGGSCSTASAR